MSNIQTVQAIYEAFGRGDVPFIIDQVDADVRWDAWDPPGPAHTGAVPYLVPRSGPAGVAEFFGSLAVVDITAFAPTNLLEGDDQVAAVVEIAFEVKATGARAKDVEVHLWTFGPDGKVVEFRHVVDTAKHLAAHTA
jgi:ketosteroid isomerase-like protein